MTKGKKHMDGTQRCRIQFGLEASESARTIAKDIGVNLSTVMREIRKHTYESFKGCYGCSDRNSSRESESATLPERSLVSRARAVSRARGAEGSPPVELGSA